MIPRMSTGSEKYPGKGSVLTIGNFDGVHRGHQALLERTVAEAKDRGVPACVYTFDPPPRAVLQPDRHPPRIMELEDRLRIFGEFGVDEVVVERFDVEFSQRPADWFAKEVLKCRLAPVKLIVGHDFRFGQGRGGSNETLASVVPKLPFEQLQVLKVDGVVVSSSRIREWVAEGKVAEAASLLGRPHFVRGRVVRGDGRGRQIGFPTANLDLISRLVPGRGIYAATVELGAQHLDAVANLGIRPTFSGHTFCTEVHLLDYEENLYGEELRVHFVERIRDEQRFEGVEALTAQIHKDVELARQVLAQ